MHCNTTGMCAVTVRYVTQGFSVRMRVSILIVAVSIFAVVVTRAHAEAQEDFDMSAVRLVRRVRRTYIIGRCYIQEWFDTSMSLL